MFFHLFDINSIDKMDVIQNDKFLLGQTLEQFLIFSKWLSIDKEVILYTGIHCAKK